MFRFIETTKHPESPYVGALMKHDDEKHSQNLSLGVVVKSIAVKERKGLPVDDLPKAKAAILKNLNVQEGDSSNG